MFAYAASYFGDADAQYELGRLYLDGTPSDAHEAARWFLLAATKGQCRAEAALGDILFRGQYVPRQAARGLMWLTLGRDCAGPDESWVKPLYDNAFHRANDDERAMALVYLKDWLKAAGGISGSRYFASIIQIDPHRHVVGRLFPGPHVAIDADAGEPVGGGRRQQHVIDADAVVLLPGAGLIIPERIEAGIVAGGAQRIGQAEIDQRAEFVARARQEQSVAGPGFADSWRRPRSE